MRPHRTFIAALGAAALLALAACGSASAGGSSGTSGSSGSSGSNSGSSAPTLSIVSPAAGTTTVAEPFTLKVASSVPLGAPSTGKDHIHVFLNGATGPYQVLTASTMTIRGLKVGKHTIMVTLNNADHSPAGPKAQITVNVTRGGTAGSGGGTSSTPSPGGYGY